MTTLIAEPASQTPVEPISHRKSLSLLRTWTSSFLVYFYPAKVGNLWLGVSLAKSIIVMLVNLALSLAWLTLIIVSVAAWSGSRLHVNAHNFNSDFVPRPVHTFLELFGTVPQELYSQFSRLDILEKNALILFCLMATLTALAICFFCLLPFAARPSRNKSCVQHVIRAVLLGTGFVHVGGPVITALFILLITYRYAPDLAFILGPLLVTLSVLILWAFAALIIAVRRDYRTQADLPQPHDPTCDDCGYNLVAADLHGRCPECGKPVIESIGPDIRPVTAWERNPSLLNFQTIRHQLARLIREPRKLFLDMPTLTGQPAAHRWLLYSLLLILMQAFLIVPALWFFEFRGDSPFTLDYIWGGLIVGIMWAIFALMMVGIETAGIAGFSKMKGHPVYLAAAAKVTAYSSPLMLLWVLLGAAQLILTVYLFDHNFFRHYSIRVEQVYLAISLSIAHIGGLLWYELTVYRGVRSIQYANK
jgi:hypothetical protein